MSDPKDNPPDATEALAALAEAIAGELASGRTVDLELLAGRFRVDPQDARKVKDAVEAIGLALGEDPPASPSDLPAPTLPPDYELLGEIGRGGMGVVYRVRQRSLGRTVALKVLQPGELVFGSAIRRFQKEAQSLARLRHRHIVSIHEVGESGGQVYYTMDLIEGTSLAELIRQKQVTPTRAVKLLRQVASAIAYAHAQGIIHRDLKPANILVDPAGDAYVVDFGLARDAAVKGDLTTQGQVLGTPAYMSPEQARGEAALIGEATDVYSLGAVLYECLSGRPPFRGTSLADLIHAVIHEDPAPLRRLSPKTPRDLDVICQKALSKEPGRRYATVRALLEDLERFEEGRPILARRPSLAYRATRFAVRQAAPLAAASITGVLLLLVVLTFLVPRIGNTPETLLETAKELQAAGQHRGAVVLLDRALKERPSEATQEALRAARLASRLEVIRSLEKEGQWAEAEALCRKELKGYKRESEPEILWELSRCLAKRGEREEASTMLDDMETALEDRRTQDHMISGEWPDSSPSIGLALLDRAAPALLDPNDPGHDAAGVLFLRSFGTWFRKGVNPDRWFREQGDRAVDLTLAMIPFLPRENLGTDGSEFSNEVTGLPGTPLDKGLIALARNGSAAPLSRRFAAEFLCQRRDLPTWFGSWREDRPVGDDLALIEKAADLAESQLGLGVEAAYRRRVEDGLAHLEGPFHGDFDSWWLSAWLTDHTGFMPSGKESPERSVQWRDWWKGHGAERPAEWLRRALGLEGSLTPEEILQRYLSEPELDRRILLHNLLVVSEPEVTPMCLRRSGWGRGEPPGRAMAWYEAIRGSRPAESYVLRIAHLSFRNASPEPILVWQETRPIRVGEQVTSATHVQSTLFHTEVMRMQIPGIEYQFGIPEIAKESARERVNLAWRQDGLILKVGQQDSPQGLVGFDNDFYPSGRAPWPYHQTPVTMAVAAPPGSDPREWTLADWKAKFSRDLPFLLDGLRSDTGRKPAPFFIKYQQPIRLYPQMAAHIPFPECQETLKRLDQAVRGHELMKRAQRDKIACWLPARLLAGDASALDESGFYRDLKSSFDSHKDAVAYSCRLYQSARDPRIREVALGLMKAELIPPEILLAILPRMRSGELPAPDWLLKRAEEADQIHQENVGIPRRRCYLAGGLGALAAMAALGFTLWPGRPRHRRLRGAALLVLVGLGYVAGVAELDGHDLLPDSVGYGLSALGAFILACSARSRLAFLPAAAFLLAGLLVGLSDAASLHREELLRYSTTLAGTAIVSLPILIRALDRVSPSRAGLPRRWVLLTTFPFAALFIALVQIGSRVEPLQRPLNELLRGFPFLLSLIPWVILIGWTSLFSAARMLSRRLEGSEAPLRTAP